MEDKSVDWREGAKKINEETKLCKYCQTEISKKAKVCPNCRKKQKGGFLKWIVIVVVAIIAVSCVAGGGNDGDSESEKEPETNTETIKEISEHETEEETEKIIELSVESSEIYNDNGIVILTNGVETSKNKTSFLFEIQNNCEKDYSIAAHSYDINGLMAGTNIGGFGPVDVPANKKAKLSIEIDNDWLDENEIKFIKNINVIFWSYYDGFKDWDTGMISIPTNYSETQEEYEPVGEMIYSDEKISVFQNGDFSFLVLNKSGYNASYTVENCSVNDWSYEITNYTYDLYDEEIHDNAYDLFDLEIDDDFLKENNIEEIKNVEFDILISDSYWEMKGEKWEHKTEKIKIDL